MGVWLSHEGVKSITAVVNQEGSSRQQDLGGGVPRRGWETAVTLVEI